MAKQNKKRSKKTVQETDSTYFLKLVMYVVFGSFWLRFGDPISIGAIQVTAIPIGLFIGLLFVRYDHFQVDRKIEYAVLILVAVLSLYLPTGIVL